MISNCRKCRKKERIHVKGLCLNCYSNIRYWIKQLGGTK